MKLSKTCIAMIHVPALPGAPLHKLSTKDIIAKCVEEARVLYDVGFDGLMLENMHDVPYMKSKASAEIVAMMTAVAIAVKKEVSIPVGIQILAGANKEALAVAKAADLDFIRAEGFVFGHLGDEGYHDSCAGELLRYRKQIDARHVSVFADIKKKHSSHAITEDVHILETAKAAEFFLADGLVITGNSTGQEVSMFDLKSLHNKLNIPILLGSGITPDNLPQLWDYAEGFIIGSYLKKDGNWKNELNKTRLQRIIATIRNLKKIE